jgi:UDP-N-acetylmuramate dehydrogenase
MACPQTIALIIESCRSENPCDIDVRFDEPMADHSTFKVGGPADCLIRPYGEGFQLFLTSLLACARSEGIPVFILGGGANILAADAGIRGIVLDTGGWAGETGQGEVQQHGTLEFKAGTRLNAAAVIAANAGLSGLEFLAGMPGSIGGAVYMNARCYGREIADVLTETEVIDFSSTKPEQLRLSARKTDFSYKFSPFQGRDFFIISASFQLVQKDKALIFYEMDAHKRDREDKGHYRYPCAGSVYKNNPAFGKSTGKIIDELGLRGLQIGGARVADWHGNIIINTTGAAAADIRNLINEVAARVKEATGFLLEPEILFVGSFTA